MMMKRACMHASLSNLFVALCIMAGSDRQTDKQNTMGRLKWQPDHSVRRMMACAEGMMAASYRPSIGLGACLSCTGRDDVPFGKMAGDGSGVAH